MAEIQFPLESFVFYRSFRDAIEEMDDADKLSTLLAICDYALYGVEPELESPMPRAIFTVARPSIDANNTRRMNGEKGGRPRKKKPLVFKSENQGFSKLQSTESMSETGTSTKGPATPSRSHFVPPSADEVRDYCQENGYQLDPERFVAFYEATNWTRGKTKIKDWRACVRTWVRQNKDAPQPALSRTTYTPPVSSASPYWEVEPC